jgi:predicted RNA binding protein YcfA (HicA-like mRNA interferase family)
MKSTAERLSESYCRPNEIDWKAIELIDDERVIRHYRDWSICATVGSLLGRTEIPVSHFIDLMRDSIVPWRLEEDGFVFYRSTGQHVLQTNELKRYHVTLPPMSNTVKVDVWDGDKGITADGITTYTDLLTLIRLIG